MKTIKYTCFLSFFIIAVFANAQQNIDFTKENFKTDKDGLREAIKNIKLGDDLYERGEIWWKDAIEPYQKAQDFNPNNAYLNFRLGHCYLHSPSKLSAVPFLEKAQKLNPMIDKQLYFLLGEAYHYNYEWDKAIEQYRKQATFLTDYKEDRLFLEKINKKIEECNNGKELMKHPVKVFIDNLGPDVNTEFPEYGPVISADESVMMFTSKRNTTTGGNMDQAMNVYFEDIYISVKKGKSWGAAVNIGKPINTEGHDATAGLSPDGQILYVYIDDGGDGNIYECNLKGEEWSKPDRLNSNIDTKNHETSASLSFDGKRLYFVRRGAKEDVHARDIFYSEMDKKGRWGEPVNVGPPINTIYGEEGVFIHPDGKTMYFSSQAHTSMGGYDIFRSTLENGKWSEPVNLGYPINTPDDDVFFVVSASGKHGYYSSFGNGFKNFGEKDMYMITFLTEKDPVLNNEDNLLASAAEPVKETVLASAVQLKTAQITILKGVITDKLSGKPLIASIDLVDNEKNEVIATFSSNTTTGKYLVSLPSGKNYGIAVKADGYLFHSENFDILASASYQEIIKDVALEKVDVGSKIILKNIFFDFDKATLRSESTAELERLTKLLTDNGSLKIEISGHTDNKGSATYNQTLSESRSKSVVDYLISKGISASRLQYKGYGLSQPISTNDTEEGRQLNRRTEFKRLSK